MFDVVLLETFHLFETARLLRLVPFNFFQERKFLHIILSPSDMSHKGKCLYITRTFKGLM